MPVPLITNASIRGVANLNKKDHAKLKLSNAVADKAGRLALLADQFGIVGGEENPATSFLWLFPSRVKFKQRTQVASVVVD